jgi:polysaccharide chain length determinant protein (PEP-CTERM system associated)
MQPGVDSYSVQRRQMDVEDYIDILRRHRSWIAGPAFAGLVIAVMVAFFWPDTFVSDATIRIVPPTVPERYVASNVNLQVGQRIASMYQSVTTRANLLGWINSLALYPRKKGRVADDDLVEEMRRAISMGVLAGMREPLEGRNSATAFRISFSYNDRYVAQNVVSKIVDKLLSETTQVLSSESKQTNDFLKDKVKAAKDDLDAIEAKVETYKRSFAGKLPDQLQSNLATLQTLDTQFSSASTSLSRASQDKLSLENQLRLLNDQLQSVKTASLTSAESAAKNDKLNLVERQIQSAETNLIALQEKYRDTHPDVRSAQAQLAGLRQVRDALLKEEEQKPPAPKKKESSVLTSEQLGAEAAISRLQSMIQSKEAEIEGWAKEQARLSKQINDYQQRIDAIPGGERAYVQLTRDYNLAKAQYQDLVVKSNQSQMATELEGRQQGEGMEVLEPASLPQTPTEPNRWVIVAAGCVLGLGLGIFLAVGREMRDTSLKNLKDVRAYTGLPILGSVPLVQSDFVAQRKRRLAWLAWSSACILGFAMMLGSVYYHYYLTKGT